MCSAGTLRPRKEGNQKEHDFGNALRYRLCRQSELYLAIHGEARTQVEIRDGYLS